MSTLARDISTTATRFATILAPALELTWRWCAPTAAYWSTPQTGGRRDHNGRAPAAIVANPWPPYPRSKRVSCVLAGVARSVALGLPPRRQGYGLVLFRASARRWTWAGDPAVVAALDEHAGELSEWERHFEWEAEGWPTIRQDGRLETMSWRRRRSSD
jgi:hypothetical protein